MANLMARNLPGRVYGIVEKNNTSDLEECVCIFKDIIQELNGMKVKDINQIRIQWKEEIICKGMDKKIENLINEVCDIVIKLKITKKT